ncbi:hypothetical protein ABT040_43290, partial [Streptomyces sp. NPDC002688]
MSRTFPRHTLDGAALRAALLDTVVTLALRLRRRDQAARGLTAVAEAAAAIDDALHPFYGSLTNSRSARPRPRSHSARAERHAGGRVSLAATASRTQS